MLAFLLQPFLYHLVPSMLNACEFIPEIEIFVFDFQVLDKRYFNYQCKNVLLPENRDFDFRFPGVDD